MSVPADALCNVCVAWEVCATEFFASTNNDWDPKRDVCQAIFTRRVELGD